MSRRVFAWVALFWACATAWSGDLILVGAGGSPEYERRFRDWGLRLQAALTQKLGRPAADVRLLLPDANDDAATGAATRDNLRATLNRLAQSHDAEQDLFIYLIGHGSHLRDVSKFQLPGPDVSAADLAQWLAPIPAKRMVLVHGGSASAGFVNALSGPDRVICTATKSVREVNAAEFMEFLIQGLEDGSADQNRDERISIWEAGRQAALLTQTWYSAQKLIATEHALLDDNGDGLGTRLAQDPNARPAEGQPLDGALAKRVYLKDLTFPDTVPKEKVQRYLALLRAIEQLRDQKGDLAEADYYRRLERELIKASRLHREIRRLAGWN